MITSETDLLTVAEAARLLRVSVPTVWRWVDTGTLPALRVGKRSVRIRRDDLERVLRSARPGQEEMTERYTIHIGDERTDQLALVEQLVEAQKALTATRKGKALSPSAPLIREAREERTTRL